VRADDAPDGVNDVHRRPAGRPLRRWLTVIAGSSADACGPLARAGPAIGYSGTTAGVDQHVADDRCRHGPSGREQPSREGFGHTPCPLDQRTEQRERRRRAVRNREPVRHGRDRRGARGGAAGGAHGGIPLLVTPRTLLGQLLLAAGPITG